MVDNLDYETYLFISSKKLIISVNTDSNKKVYQNELILDNNKKELNFDKLDYFLNENIFEIEKKLKNFIKKTSVILDLDIFFPVEISIKRNNYENLVNLKILNHLLYEAKDCCKKTIDGKKIIHMIIDSYKIDNKSYSFLPNDIRCKNFSLDIKFVCISTSLIKDLKKIFRKYQISLNHIVSANYIEKLFLNEEIDIFLMSKKILKGHNPNEVLLVEKIKKNQGFFEKFFNYFN